MILSNLNLTLNFSSVSKSRHMFIPVEDKAPSFLGVSKEEVFAASLISVADDRGKFYLMDHSLENGKTILRIVQALQLTRIAIYAETSPLVKDVIRDLYRAYALNKISYRLAIDIVMRDEGGEAFEQQKTDILDFNVLARSEHLADIISKKHLSKPDVVALAREIAGQGKHCSFKLVNSEHLSDFHLLNAYTKEGRSMVVIRLKNGTDRHIGLVGRGVCPDNPTNTSNFEGAISCLICLHAAITEAISNRPNSGYLYG